jgi:hypothetical protein
MAAIGTKEKKGGQMMKVVKKHLVMDGMDQKALNR